MAMNLKFKELKKYISVIDRLSICMRETLQYENYTQMRDVPDQYDDFYVYGIGRIQSEFKIAESGQYSGVQGNEMDKEYFMGECIEIVLSERPRDQWNDACNWNEWAYVGTRYKDTK